MSDTYLDSVQRQLTTDFARLYGREAASLDPRATFIELGADSLLLLRA